MAKQSSDELDYKDFLKQISKLASKISVVDEDISFTKPKKSAKEVYQELCYDFPLVTKEELETLKDYLQTVKLDSKPSAIQIARRSYYDGIIYGARKHQSDTSAPKSEKPTEDSEQQRITKLYNYICALTFIKYIKHYTQLASSKDIDSLNKELSFFKHKSKKNDSQPYEDEPAKPTEPENPLEETLLAKDQDNDDTPYEPIDMSNHNFFAWEEKEQDIEGTKPESACSWAELCEKISEIMSLISYDLIASDQVWEELNIAQDIITIIDNIRKSFKANSQVDLRNKIPWFIFLIRDRMLHFPNTVNKLLPLCLSALRITNDRTPSAFPEDKYNAMMAVSIFAGLVVSHSKEIAPELIRHISNYINFFASRTSYITSTAFNSSLQNLTQDLANELAALSQIVQFFVEKNSANNVPDVLMSSGIFRDFVQLFSKFKYQESIKACRVTLLIMCSRYEKLCSFVTQVPDFISNIEEEEFSKNFPAESCFWFVTFSVHSKQPKDQQVYLEKSVSSVAPMLESLTSDKTLRTISELLNYLVGFRIATSAGKTFLANRKNVFVDWLSILQKKINEFKFVVDDNSSEESKIKDEKQRSQVNNIRAQLKDVLQGGKGD